MYGNVSVTVALQYLRILQVYIKRNNMKISPKDRARKLKSDIPAIFLALKDKETPVSAKILATITVAYALSPIDLIPDFIPVLGYLDDVLILPALSALTIKLIDTLVESADNDGKVIEYSI